MTSKHDDPRAVLARALLGSKNHRPRATVRCGHRRHRLAAVYLLPDGRRVLAVPSNKYLHKVLHLPHPDADPAEVVTSEAWTWDLDNPDADPAARIILRCQCRSFGTSIEDVRQQLDRLAPGDTWIMASMSMTADHPVTVESRRIRAAVLDHLAAAEDAGWAELASATGASEPDLWEQLDVLERDGRITRRGEDGDGRFPLYRWALASTRA